MRYTMGSQNTIVDLGAESTVELQDVTVPNGEGMLSAQVAANSFAEVSQVTAVNEINLTGVTPVVMSGMTITRSVEAGSVVFLMVGSGFKQTSFSQYVLFTFYREGSPLGSLAASDNRGRPNNFWYTRGLADTVDEAVAGTYTYDVRWWASNAGNTIYARERTFVLSEVKR